MIGSASIDVALDVVAGDTEMDLLNVLRPHGRYATADAIAGRQPTIHWPTLYPKRLDILGCLLTSHDEFMDLSRMIFSGNLALCVAAVFPLTELSEAQSLFKSKGFFGKIVIQVAYR